MRVRLNQKLTRHTLSVVGIYIFVSILWILFSDQLVTSFFDDQFQRTAQTYKGIFFVLATAAFLFLLIGNKNRAIRKLFERLRERMRFFQDTFEHAAVGIAHLSPDEEWIRVNSKLCEMLGYTKPELKSLTLADIVHPDDLGSGRSKDQQLLSGKKNSYMMKKRYVTKDDEIFNARITKSSINNGDGSPKYLIAVIEDISREREITENLKKSLRQKNLLMREIHHRVKNNLAIISGLLELQAYNAEEQRVQKVLRDSMMRIKSMALIHESFYQSRNLSYVAFDIYLKDFIDHLRAALDFPDKEINIKLSTATIRLNINQAIPLGLLINELVINAYLHAFEDRNEGEIYIDLQKEGQTIMLKVEDNGMGLPAEYCLDGNTSLGTTIIKTLAMQLDGEIRTKSEEGAQITFVFESKEKSGSSSSLSTQHFS